jgi:hypothetical protein
MFYQDQSDGSGIYTITVADISGVSGDAAPQVDIVTTSVGVRSASITENYIYYLTSVDSGGTEPAIGPGGAPRTLQIDDINVYRTERRDFWKPTTTYSVDDKVWIRGTDDASFELTCTVAGTSDASLGVSTPDIGSPITDDTVTWDVAALDPTWDNILTTTRSVTSQGQGNEVAAMAVSPDDLTLITAMPIDGADYIPYTPWLSPAGAIKTEIISYTLESGAAVETGRSSTALEDNIIGLMYK